MLWVCQRDNNDKEYRARHGTKRPHPPKAYNDLVSLVSSITYLNKKCEQFFMHTCAAGSRVLAAERKSHNKTIKKAD